MFVDIKFSENLSVPVKFKPQSLHWSLKQVIVHSGITKACSEKTYHVHLSDDKKHDQFFVHLELTNMINNANALDHSYIITESDIWKLQYKSSAHFLSIQELANKCAVTFVFSDPNKQTKPTYVLKWIDSKELWLLGTEAKLKILRQFKAVTLPGYGFPSVLPHHKNISLTLRMW